MAETIVLDPTAIATGRTQLDITSYVAAAGPNWGDAEIQAYMADQQVGSTTIDYRLPNRTITIPLVLRTLGATAFATIRQSLEQKIGLIQRQRGWIMRQVGAIPLYADVQSATLHLGGAYFQAFGTYDVDAVLTLECVPDWYGAEVTLSDHVETTLPHLLFTEPTVNGNYPGRVRIVVDNDQTGQNQNGMLWGLRARNYDSAATAALFYQAEALTPLNGASATSHAGSSGSAVALLWPGLAGQWVPMLATKISASGLDLTHKGSYRVWIRAQASVPPPPSFRLQWGPAGLAAPVVNAPATVPAGNGLYYLLDLGVIRIDAPPVGNNVWQGVIQASSNDTTVNGNTYWIDCMWLQPLDESAGQAIYTPTAPASSVSVIGSPSAAANDAATGTIVWSNPTNVSAEDSSYASAALTSGQVTEWLKASSYTFTIPSGATINGFVVNVFFTGSSGSFGINGLHLVKAGTVQAGNAAASSTSTYGSDSVFTAGSPTDLWGTTWATTDTNATGFGCAVSMTSLGATVTVQVNYMRITIYYTLASGFTIAQDSVIYALQSAELRTEGLFRQASGTAVYSPATQQYGDLPRLPPSGLEGGTIEALIKLTRGDLGQLPDGGIDDLSAKITYRPSYLFTP